MIQKKDTFNNQKAMVLPKGIQMELELNPLTNLLFITDIGYYHEAKFHYRERFEECDQNILIFCTDGSGWVEVEGITRKIIPNTFLIIRSGQPHKYGADNNNPWSIYWMHFKGIKSSSFINSPLMVSEMKIQKNTRSDRRIRLFEEIYQTLSMGYSKENLEYSSICLWYLLGAFKYIPQFERIRAIQQDDIIEKSILYMYEHLNETLNLQKLADHVGYSVSYFSAIFKKKTTRSAIEYFLNLKMQYACQQLDFTAKRINEIALELSIEDQFYFSRIFKRLIGVSPSDYRKNKKG